MDSKRLLLVTPRFWPISGPRELLATGLAEELAQSGHAVTVLTGRIARMLPESFDMGGVTVVRLPKRRDGLLDSLRRIKRRQPWIDELQRWLPRHREQFDFAILLANPDETGSAVDVLTRNGLPAVVRCTEDSHRPGNSGLSPAQSPLVRWVDSRGNGSTPADVLSIPDGVSDMRCQELSRQQVRESLQAAHPLFELRDDALLAVCPAELNQRNGMFELVQAWRHLCSRFPTARLWLTGEGADGYELFHRIRELEMEHAIILPGNFDEIHDVLQAADAIIMPGGETPVEWYAYSALLQQVPLICNAANCNIRNFLEPASGQAGNGHIGNGSTDGGQSKDSVFWFDGLPNTLEATLLNWAETSIAGRSNRPLNRGQTNGELIGEPIPYQVTENSMRNMAQKYLAAGQSLIVERC